MYNLFLDDLRFPEDVTWVLLPKDTQWVIVRSYSEFQEKLMKDGIPQCISFDFDLGDFSENPKTGLDCVSLLLHTCLQQQLPLPHIFIHSMQSSGRIEMVQCIESFRQKHKNIL